MNLQPIGVRVVVKPSEDQDMRTSSGLVIPDTAKEKPQRGLVLAVGEGRWVDGARVALEVSDGDEVIYSKYGGTEVSVGGDDLLVLNARDVLAIVEK